MYKLLIESFRLLMPFTWIDKKNKIATLTTICLVLINTAGNIYAPKILGIIVEKYNELDLIDICGLTIILTSCWCAQYILVYIKNIIFYVVTNRAIRDIRLKVILHLHKISTSLSGQYNSSEVINANERVPLATVNFMNTIFINFAPAIINIIAISITMIYLMKVGILFILITLLSYIPAYIVFKKYVSSRYKVWTTGDRVRIVQMESLQNQIASRINFIEENNRVSKAFHDEADAWEKNNKYNYDIHIYQELLFFCAGGAITFYATYLLKESIIPISTYVSLGGYMFSLHRSINTVTCNLKTLFSSIIDMEKILLILSIPIPKESNPTTKIIDKPKTYTNALDIRNIYHSYDENSEEGLKNISLTVKKFDRIAITGPSGAGKSTLCRILSGIYKPNKGSISFFDQYENMASPDLLSNSIQIIGQDCSLLEGSIKDNLFYYGKNIPKSILEYFEGRLEDPVGDFGMKLSNGERQRILIARCIARNPEIVILDETFSGLDTKSSLELLKNIFDNIPTVILVTHQQYLLQNFKTIYTLDKGILSPSIT